MYDKLLDKWLDCPLWLRWTLCIIFLGISTLLYFRDIFWPYGWVVGGVLLLVNLFVND